MKKFSKILESNENRKFFEVDATIKLYVEAENEGEAGYDTDSILGGVKEHSDFKVLDIKEISPEEYNKNFRGWTIKNEAYGIGFDTDNVEDSNEEKILKAWLAEFGDKTPTTTEKMEFYHQMRTVGFDGLTIMKALDNRISPTWMKKQSEQ